VAVNDVDALADMTGLATELDELISRAVAGLRGPGYSWAEIAARLGVTRQAAQQRWRHAVRATRTRRTAGAPERRAINGPLAVVNNGQLRAPKDTRPARSGPLAAAGGTPSKLVMPVRSRSPALLQRCRPGGLPHKAARTQSARARPSAP
jgi:hypothetical protein